MTPPTDAVDASPSPANASPSSPPPAPVPLVEAPGMAITQFPSWEAFSAYFHVYQRQTFQVYRCKTSTSVATRNQRIVQIVANKSKYSLNPNAIFAANPVIPAEMDYYAKTMICTHAGKPRSRSRGLRPNHQLRAMQCPARISVLTQKKSGDHYFTSPSGWQVVVTQQKPVHNHPVDAETFEKYPHNRRVEDPMVLEAVNALRKAGVKRRDIRKYITEKEPSKHVTRCDVNNLLTKLESDDSFVTRLSDAAQVATTRGDSRNEFVNTVAASNEVEQLASASNEVDEVVFDTTGDQEVAAERTEVALQPADSSVRFTLRRSNGGKGERVIAAEGASQGGNRIPSIQRLCDDNQVTSSSFKLRVSRLEEQNVALYAQNTKLHEQNQLLVAELNDACQKARAAEAKVLMRQRSEATLAEGVSVLSQEVTRMKAEVTKWRLLALQGATHTAPSESGSQISPVAVGSDTETHATTQHLAKRALSASSGEDASESVRPQKRAATHLTAEASASTEESSSAD